MTTLAEIEAAADALPRDEQRALLEWLAGRLRARIAELRDPHGVLDIPPISLGNFIPPHADEDLLEEMLEERR